MVFCFPMVLLLPLSYLHNIHHIWFMSIHSYDVCHQQSTNYVSTSYNNKVYSEILNLYQIISKVVYYIAQAKLNLLLAVELFFHALSGFYYINSLRKVYQYMSSLPEIMKFLLNWKIIFPGRYSNLCIRWISIQHHPSCMHMYL